MKAFFFSLLATTVLTLAGCSGPNAMAGGDTADYIYVCNQGEATVSVIDASLNEVVATVDLKTMGYPENAKPHHVVVEPDGSHWYLSMIGANRVLKFNRQNEVVGQVDIQVPGMLALNPDGRDLYVGRSMSAVNPPQSIGVIERGSMELDEVDVFFPRPHALAVTPDGDHIFSASLAENRMIVLDQESGDGTFHEFDGDINTLVQFAIAPDGNTAIVGGELTNKLFFLDLTALPEISVRSHIEVGSRPWHPIFAADGRHAYFGNKGANTVTVVDTQSGSIAATIAGEGMAQPHGTAISADGRFIYVSQQNTGSGGMNMSGGGMNMSGGSMMKGMVTVIDTETNEIAKVIQVGMMPSGVGSRGLAR